MTLKYDKEAGIFIDRDLIPELPKAVDPIPIHVPGITIDIIIHSCADFDNAWEEYGEGDCPEDIKKDIYNFFRYSFIYFYPCHSLKLIREPIEKVGEIPLEDLKRIIRAAWGLE